MPDHSFPDAKPSNKPSNGLPSATQSLVGFDQKPSFSSLVSPAQGAWDCSYQESLPIHQPEVSSRLPLTFYADPLAPLRQSDEQALDDIFDDSQVEDILADVCLRLRQLPPEPCWEDRPFDFLQRYL